MARGAASTYFELEPPNVQNEELQQVVGVDFLCELRDDLGLRRCL